MGIFKFTPNGQRAYATYLGGNGNDYPHSLICDPQGNLVIMGKTFSTNYPGTLKGKGGGSDIAVTKLNAAGTAIIGSLRIGGTSNDGVNIKDQLGATMTPNATFRFYGDDSRSEVILDKANNILLIGSNTIYRINRWHAGNNRRVSAYQCRRTGWYRYQDQPQLYRYHLVQLPGRQWNRWGVCIGPQSRQSGTLCGRRYHQH